MIKSLALMITWGAIVLLGLQSIYYQAELDRLGERTTKLERVVFPEDD